MCSYVDFAIIALEFFLLFSLCLLHFVFCVTYAAYAGHVLRGSSGLNALLIMEGKISGVKARERPRRAWTDDLKDWTQLKITVN